MNAPAGSMTPRDYGETIHFATELQLMSGYLDTHQLNQRAQIEASFRAKANRLVYGLLRDCPDAAAAAAAVEADLEAIAASSDPPLPGALDETRAYMLERIERESRKSPRLRAIARWTPVAIGVAAVIVYFGIRYMNLLDVDAPAQSREGIVQRAAAFQKARDYDPPSGFSLRVAAANVLMWPMEPTREETEAAREFFLMSEAAFASLSRQGRICLDPATHPVGVDPAQRIELAGRAAAHVLAPGVRWAEPPADTLAIPILQALPCR